MIVAGVPPPFFSLWAKMASLSHMAYPLYCSWCWNCDFRTLLNILPKPFHFNELLISSLLFYYLLKESGIYSINLHFYNSRRSWFRIIYVVELLETYLNSLVTKDDLNWYVKYGYLICVLILCCFLYRISVHSCVYIQIGNWFGAQQY